MALLPIRKYGDPVLRAKAKPVEVFDETLAILAEDMIETMRAAEGIGLAAPQVGKSICLIVVETGLIEEGEDPSIFVNPVILDRYGEKICMEEGCLSVPGITEEVTREESIKLRYQDLSGQAFEGDCHGTLARVIMHEVDHLLGNFFTDYLGSMKLRMLSKKLGALQFEAQKDLIEFRKMGVA
ncbi:MAG: peptide deformylase [Calditrichaeota bacterium]|nr:MAG: peptide deformylase [Calditrichota bacterium]